MSNYFQFSNLSKKLVYFLVFIVALTLRALPEFQNPVYPVGFDTIAGYVPAITALPDLTPMKLFGWAWSPLALYILAFVQWVTRIDPYFLLKIAAPVFYGFFILCFYQMTSKGLKWDKKKSIIVTFIFMLQPAVMRTGWDQLREQLGLGFIFLLLAETDLDFISGAKVKPVRFIVLSILIVLSHQLAGILLFVVLIWQILLTIKNEKSMLFRSFMIALPSVLIFVWQIYNQFFTPNLSTHFLAIKLDIGTSTFIFSNYFLNDPRFLDGNYINILKYVGSLSLYTIIPLIPLALKGFRRDKVFTPMLIWLSITSYSILFCPTYAFSAYWWWILLLPIPLTIFVGEGLDKLGLFKSRVSSFRRKIFWIAFLLLGIIGFSYATSIINLGNPYANSYMPSGMVEYTIPPEDIPDVENAFEWLNEKTAINSMVIVEEKIMGLAYLNLRSDFLIRVAASNLELGRAVDLVNSAENRVYAVWYVGDLEQGGLPYNIMATFNKIAILEIRNLD